MKKLVALAPLALVLAACAGPEYKAPVNAVNVPVTAKAYDRMAPERFTCEDDAVVDAKYSVDGEEAMLTASLPKAKWNQQTLTLQQAATASGMRFVNDVSDNVTYEWHAKGDMGMMSLNWADGTSYSVNCERN